MYKIAHISDMHISYNDSDGHGRRLVRLLKDIEDMNCDHVIITGDLVENPKAEDYQYTKEILSHYGLLDSSRMTVVPGNHDIFGGAQKGVQGVFFTSTCKNTDYEKTLDRFIDTFKETFPSNNAYPFLKIIGNIAIVAVNSIDRWSVSKNPEGSNGRISNVDFKKIKKMLSSNEIKDKFKLVLLHHHFNKPEINDELPGHSLWLKVINWKMKLYGKKKLLTLFKKYDVNLVLHGHTHVNDIYNSDGVSIVNSSSCLMPLTDDQIRKYNIIYIPDKNDADKNLKIETITLQ